MIIGPRTCMTWVTPSLVYNGEDEGSGTTTAFPGERDSALSLVAISSSGPADLKIAAFSPPPPEAENYDLYGDEVSSPGFDAGDSGQHGGYSYFTCGGSGQSGFNFKPGGWQNMGGQEGGYQYGNRRPAESIPSVNSQLYRNEIVNNGMTWPLLFYISNLRGIQYYESVIEEVAASLQGALKVGSISRDSDASFCKELGVYPRREPKIFVYSYASGEKGVISRVCWWFRCKIPEKFLSRSFAQIFDLGNLNIDSEPGKLPKVLLLS
ncbi:hypothetical protein BUALT_Bualt09G0127600 [Buddleja alternifolia]|uniref:Uncharacterized protein n=1 Tax=Buddleja alternifolia TaxID=168488 RepID=A0AAV6X3T5_9LAMI|nr:hypothetical protein BUALT_Bualt09G0127600 [Buddleja alternifolia]